jgi:Na+(H+)/acetate symporter ActP
LHDLLGDELADGEFGANTMSRIFPAVFMSSPAGFVLSGVLFQCGVPAVAALIGAFAGSALVAFVLLRKV